MQFGVVEAAIGHSVSAKQQATTLSFKLEPLDHDRIELATGEILQSRKSASVRGDDDKRIEAFLSIHRESRGRAPVDKDDAERIGSMIYNAAVGRDHERQSSSISLRIYFDDLEFDRLIDALLKQMPPRSFNFEWDALEDGDAPDGSVRKWDNTKTRLIPITHTYWNTLVLSEPEEVGPAPDTVIESNIKVVIATLRKINARLTLLIVALAVAAAYALLREVT